MNDQLRMHIAEKLETGHTHKVLAPTMTSGFFDQRILRHSYKTPLINVSRAEKASTV